MRLLRIGSIAAVLGVTAANGVLYYRHHAQDAAAMQVITSQLQASPTAENAARLRGSMAVLSRIDREMLLQAVVLDIFLISVATVIWLRTGARSEGPP